MPYREFQEHSMLGDDFDVLVIHPILLHFFCAKQLITIRIEIYNDVWELGSSKRNRIKGKTTLNFELVGERFPEVLTDSFFNGLEDYEVYLRRDQEILKKAGVIGVVTQERPGSILGVFY